ncbi:MAG: hypothetical protein WCF54_08025 [Terracidiphilus sp.]
MQVGLTIGCSAFIQLGIGIAILSAMKQQLTDLVGWVKSLTADVKNLAQGQKEHEGRLSHVEGRLGIPRESCGEGR